MRIAQVSPLSESVPPALYGGTERVVSYLSDALVQLGHDVTLFASGDSQTTARLVAGCPVALWRDPEVRETLPHHVRLIELVFQQGARFDVIHFHTDYLHFPLVRRHHFATVTTLHGLVHPHDVQALFEEYGDVPLVSISDSQRAPVPSAGWQGTVYHGLPWTLFHPADAPRDYLAFLGRISPEKGVDHAIEVARLSGVPLTIAAKIYPEERAYFDTTVTPFLDASKGLVRFIGEIGGPEKEAFLGGARALVFPIEWAEPFGLVLIEALACGTPVIAWGRGSVPEIIDEGVTGFIVDSVAEAVAAVRKLDAIDRAACRRAFEARFDADRMASEYVKIYRQVIARRQA
jgi:glycosyltransferase involved in cell wall biosynthesis